MDKEFQYDQSQLHIKTYFDQDDLIPYINTFTKKNGFPDLNNEQIMDIFAITVLFLQTLLLCKTNDKIFLELFEKPSHLNIPYSIKKNKEYSLKVSNINWKTKKTLGIF